MSTKDKILHRLTRSDAVRRTYTAIRSLPGLGLVLQKAAHAVVPQGIRILVKVPAGLGQGLWMYADPRFELGYTNGDHEPWIQELIKTELRPGGCYYDVGAHSGFFSLIGARFVGPSGSVVAIEPDPRNATLIKANIARNGLTQILVLQAAVWSSSGEVVFQQDPDFSNRTQGHISKEDNSGLRVQAVRLDDLVFVKGYPKPDLMKIDVEGAEWEALQAATRVLAESRPKLLCEVHDLKQMSQIKAFLEQFDYVTEPWNPVHEHYAEYRQAYLWAVPRRGGAGLSTS